MGIRCEGYARPPHQPVRRSRVRVHRHLVPLGVHEKGHEAVGADAGLGHGHFATGLLHAAQCIAQITSARSGSWRKVASLAAYSAAAARLIASTGILVHTAGSWSKSRWKSMSESAVISTWFA